MNSSKSSFVIMAIQAFIICLSNLHDEIQSYIPRIIQYLTKKLNYDTYVSQIILEFLMRKFHFVIEIRSLSSKNNFLDLLFANFHDISLISHFFQILINIINQYRYQTAHNLILSHTILCFYFNRLSTTQRQIFSYFILRVRLIKTKQN